MQTIIRRATQYNPVLISDMPSGRLCQLSVCYPNPCQNGAQCSIQSDNEFTCNCLPGWTGRVCDSPIDYCRDFCKSICNPNNFAVCNLNKIVTC